MNRIIKSYCKGLEIFVGGIALFTFLGGGLVLLMWTPVGLVMGICWALREFGPWSMLLTIPAALFVCSLFFLLAVIMEDAPKKKKRARRKARDA